MSSIHSPKSARFYKVNFYSKLTLKILKAILVSFSLEIFFRAATMYWIMHNFGSENLTQVAWSKVMIQIFNRA